MVGKCQYITDEHAKAKPLLRMTTNGSRVEELLLGLINKRGSKQSVPVTAKLSIYSEKSPVLAFETT